MDEEAQYPLVLCPRLSRCAKEAVGVMGKANLALHLGTMGREMFHKDTPRQWQAQQRAANQVRGGRRQYLIQECNFAQKDTVVGVDVGEALLYNVWRHQPDVSWNGQCIPKGALVHR